MEEETNAIDKGCEKCRMTGLRPVRPDKAETPSTYCECGTPPVCPLCRGAGVPVDADAAPHCCDGCGGTGKDLNWLRARYEPLFEIGQVFIGRKAGENMELLEINQALDWHERGDWGDLPPDEKHGNERSLLHGGPVVSRHRGEGDVLFQIRTEADRTATAVLVDGDEWKFSPDAGKRVSPPQAIVLPSLLRQSLVHLVDSLWDEVERDYDRQPVFHGPRASL